MKQKDKELLLKDLCARLPFGVKICCADNPKINGYLVGIVGESVVALSSGRADFPISDVRPYLRPMSSMTEEERKEYKHFVAFSGSPDGAANFVDWLNKNHFDYRNLIERGLAIEVTKENNPYKE